MRRLQRSTTLPIILLLYLIIMAFIGFDSVKNGETSLSVYIITIAVTLCLIIILHFFLKRREKLRDERLNDIKKSEKQ